MLITLLAVTLIGASLVVFSYVKARELEQRYPNIGTRYDIGGYELNALHLPAAAKSDLPAIVFIHGASGNLRDQVFAFREKLEGRAELLFVDRPGHGYSDRGGPENAFPDGQAASLAALMERLGIDRAIIVGHSFGGAIAASFAVLHPDKTAGLIFLSAATHPWPGNVDWYYHIAKAPVIGPLFSRIAAMPAGLPVITRAIENVFSPNLPPADYVDNTGPALVLRPAAFRANATDVANLNDFTALMSPRYREITAPTVIMTGDADAIVAEEIHSTGLARDIKGSELVWIHGLGHKPDYIATDLVIAAIEKVAGQPRDLQTLARMVEERLAAAKP